mmetsp:Transcript_18041/g.47473  ORF Transcript_18041/g.47473 Transcript_18041/m.47473 type:complete len:163 (-) Transcript_18041:2259-2747(-)
MVARGCTASNSIASVFDHHPYHPPPTTQLKELERIGRLTTSKRFGRGPRFYVVTDSAPANYYIVPLLKEKPSPYDFNLELKGAALAEKESELAKLKESVESKLASSGSMAVGGWIPPQYKGEREGEVGMCGIGAYAKPCSERGITAKDLRSASIPDLVLPTD